MKFACQNTDINTILAVLKAAGIKLLNKTLQMSYERQSGFRYDIPIFVINDPSGYELPKVEEPTEAKPIKVYRLVIS